MPLMFLVFMLSIAVGSLSLMNSPQEAIAMQEQSDAHAVKGNMWIYASAISRYKATNPAPGGSVPDAALGLPSWFQKPAGMGNMIVGPNWIVFYTHAGARPLNLTPFFAKGKATSKFGVVASGSVVSALTGAQLSQAPGISDGSVAIVL